MKNDINLQITISEEHAGLRLDQALAKLCPQYSRARLQTWLTAGSITLNNKIEKAKTKVQGGELIEINVVLDNVIPTWTAQAIPLNIVHEDNELLVVNKPANQVAHPAAGNFDNTLVNALLHHVPSLAQLPRAGLIHRLDKDTTGLLVIAKTLETHTYLIQKMQAREIKREYLAVVNGRLPGQGTIDAPIGRHPKNRQKMAVTPLGKPAVTHYKAEEYFKAHTLADIRLETGRTHQIRVHLAHIRYPIVGDITYGQTRLPPDCSDALATIMRNFGRQALHAKKLSLAHPVTQVEHEWQAPIPEDMLALIAALRESV